MNKLSLLSPLTGIVLIGLWIYGFLGFVSNVTAMREPDFPAAIEPAEAIVVLTGGSERVATGVELLKSGHGKKLLISGVHKKLSLEGVFRSLSVPEDLRNCCIVLGHRASSTIGNAKETRDWMKAEGYSSLRLVTANYHMPRSLLLFHDAMPDIVIIPFPVTPDNVKLYEWDKHPGTVLLLAREYCKFLAAQFALWMDSQKARERKNETPLPSNTTDPS
ncbi:MAG: YdcF family protein [Bdellovibrionales bacterium]